MSEIHSITQYKKSKILTKDLKDIIRIIDSCGIELQDYSRYTPVQNVLSVLLENRMLLYGYLKKYNRVLKNKGLLDEKGTK